MGGDLPELSGPGGVEVHQPGDFSRGWSVHPRRQTKAALHARRESIQLLLTNADRERDAAQMRLNEAETLVGRVDSDVAELRKRAEAEAQAERERLNEATEKEIQRMRNQAQREIETAAKLARKELQKFLAGRSVELARASVRTQIRPEDDARLIEDDIGQLRRAQA